QDAAKAGESSNHLGPQTERPGNKTKKGHQQ
ncbi:MAG: hypothetical protein ACI9K9_000823, partial [Neolewinella sp.]